MTHVFDLNIPQDNGSESPLQFLKLYRPHGLPGGGLSSLERTLTISFFITLAFFNAMCIVQLCRRKKLRSIDYLLVNMSFGVIGYCGIIVTTIYTGLIELLPISAQVKCSASNYFKYLTSSIISTASFAISYDRLSSLDKARTQRKRNVFGTAKLISFVWLVACGIILPTIMTSVPSSSLSPEILHELIAYKNLSAVPNCWRIPLFYSRFIDIWYEMVRYLFLHLSFTVSVFSEFYMVRSKIKYICMSQTGKMRSKINRVRCAFVQSILFIIVWNIFGLCNVIYTINTWYSAKSLDVINVTIKIIGGIGVAYTIVNPILLFYSNQPENSSCCCFSVVISGFAKSARTKDSKGIEEEDEKVNNSSIPDDMSRFSTRMHDTSITITVTKPIPDEVCNL